MKLLFFLIYTFLHIICARSQTDDICNGLPTNVDRSLFATKTAYDAAVKDDSLQKQLDLEGMSDYIYDPKAHNFTHLPMISQVLSRQFFPSLLS